MRRISLRSLLLVAPLAFGFATQPVGGDSQQRSHSGPPLPVETDDIGGTVSGPRGPEAGVWVIAETDLATKFRKIVVTDDQGRFLLPDLPGASYRVWVRGYGLVDSSPVWARPGQTLALKGVVAPTRRAAAQFYPANYWYSMLRVPPRSEFPMERVPEPRGEAPPKQDNLELVSQRNNTQSQAHWISAMKSSCNACHQVGDKATREIEWNLGSLDAKTAFWDRRVKSGPMGPRMSSALNQLPRHRALQMYADWSGRIEAGELPPVPPRPQGIERNVVLTEWEWGGPTDWVHSEIATDLRSPTVNANGPVYGLALGSSSIAMVDPQTHTASLVPVPTRDDPGTMAPFLVSLSGFESSPYWGTESIWKGVANLHNPMLDQRGRLWMASSIRPSANQPAFCKEGSDNAFARRFPIAQSSRQVSYYDPRTRKFTLLDTCFSTHHLVFAEDADDTLYFSGNPGIAWINTRLLDETGDVRRAQGWCLAYLDSNGDGSIDPEIDSPIAGSAYGVVVNPVDGSIWYSSIGTPGKIVRMERGSNPPATCRAEVYEPPFGNVLQQGFSPRGIDVDRNGVIWTGLSASAHLASFDRSKCAVASGAAARGQHCREGWTLYEVPGPRIRGTDVNADFLYYNWVDQFDTFGLGKNVPIASGSGSDSLLALLPEEKKWITIRVPYPMGFYSRGLDGRIDNPKAGWKGRGLWAVYGTVPTWHIEGGKGTPPILVHFQLRPNPLAR